MLEERAERIQTLEQRAEKNEDVIEKYRAREQAIVDSLAAAQNESRQRLKDAQEKADALIGEARRTAESAVQAAETSAGEIVQKAEAYRDTLIAEAKARADAMLSEAKDKSGAILSQTQAAVAEYEETLTRYNALIEENALHAREKAAQYASFLQTQKLAVPELTKTAETLADAPYAPQVELPSAEDNPAQLMRNIYTLESREIPNEAKVRPAYPTPPPEEAVVTETVEAAVAVEVELAPESAATELPDLAPRPEPEPAEESAVAVDPEKMPEPEQSSEPENTADAEEELPDLAPRPETAEWKPEDEAITPEWQPEAEMEEPGAPTVGELTGERPVDDEVEMSLDALLDEIIRAGEQ